MISAAVITLLILSVAILLLLTNVLRADLVAMLVLISLGLSGVVAPADLFTGFSRSAVITVLAIFILTHALYRTGVTQQLGRRLLSLAGHGPVRVTFVVTLAAAILSYFMNTIAAGAVLLPAVVGVSQQTEIRPSKLLMLVAYGSLLGGMATLLTTASILVNSALVNAGLAPFTLLNFLPVGGVVAIVGILFMGLIGRRFLPDRSPLERYKWAIDNPALLSDLYNLPERLYKAEIASGSMLGGKTIAQSRIGEALGLSVLAVARNGRTELAPKPDFTLRGGDILRVLGRGERMALLAEMGTKVELDMTWTDTLSSATVGLFEVLIAPRSRVVGQTLKQLHFRQKYGVTAIALWRGGRAYRTDVGEMSLEFGDALLVHGPRNQIGVFQGDSDYILLQPEAAPLPHPRKALVAAGIMIAALVAAALGWMPIAQATFAGAILMVLTGCVTMDDAYQAVDWKAIFVIAGMLPLGLAMNNTGAAAFIGQVMIDSLHTWGSIVLLGAVVLLTMLLTQFLSGQATAIIAAPIALSAAAQIQANPYTFAMGVALACSVAFLTPLAHSVNLLVMGPGGYVPRDYLKVGLPLTLVCFVVIMLVLPYFWPL